MCKNKLFLIILSLVIIISFQSITIQTYSTPIALQDENIPQELPWYFTFVFGDNRPSDTNSVELPPVFHAFVKISENARPFAIIGTGDHVGKGSIAQINEFITSTINLTNLWVIEGNHDLGTLSEQDYWHSNIAPSMYYKDAIPGWRIIFFSTELPSSEWYSLKTFLESSMNTSRNLVLILHKPLYPYVNHNIDPSLKEMLSTIIFNHDNLKCVFQGHWHGYAVAEINDVDFVITGGAGAPLYQEGSHHFVVFIMYPNGTYTYYPVMITEGLSIKYENNNVIVENSMKDLEGKPIDFPVRLKIEVNGIPVYIVGMFPPGSTTINYTVKNGFIIVTSSTQMQWYSYISTGNGTILNDTYSTTKQLYIHNLVPVTDRDIKIVTSALTKSVVVMKTRTTTLTETMVQNITETTSVNNTVTSTVILKESSSQSAIIIAAMLIMVSAMVFYIKTR